MSKKPPTLPPWVDAVLVSRPVHGREFNLGEDGHITIKVPRFNGAILGRFLMPRLKRPNFLIRLDEFGTCVWQACDGTQTGAEIAEIVAKRWPEESEMTTRVAMFLRQLFLQDHVKDAGPDRPE